MVKLDEVVSFLERVPLFEGLNKRQLERLAKRCIERDYTAGQEIVVQGQGGVGFFLIISGKAEARRKKADGSTVVVNSFGPKDFFGELALLDEGLRTASVVATEPSVCLGLTRWDFLAELQKDPEIALPILQEVVKRFRHVLDTM